VLPGITYNDSGLHKTSTLDLRDATRKFQTTQSKVSVNQSHIFKLCGSRIVSKRLFRCFISTKARRTLINGL